MCFGGSKSTNNVNTPAYAPTPEAGSMAIQQDRVASPPSGPGSANSLADRPTQSDVTSVDRRTNAAGINVRGMY
jgi:hypothetical protein